MRLDLSPLRLTAAASIAVVVGAVAFQLTSAGLASSAVFGVAVGWLFTSAVISSGRYSPESETEEVDDEEGSA